MFVRAPRPPSLVQARWSVLYSRVVVDIDASIVAELIFNEKFLDSVIF